MVLLWNKVLKVTRMITEALESLQCNHNNLKRRKKQLPIAMFLKKIPMSLQES